MPEILDFGKFSEPERKVMEITSFAGIDLSSAPFDINRKRSPDAPNMMPDSKGNPIKRTGYEFFEDYGKRINGAFSLGEHRIIHAGNSLFIDGKKVWEGMADELSSAQIVGSRLYIFDGFEALVCDGDDAHPLCEEAYVPTVLISKNADRAERTAVFTGDGETKEFSAVGIPEEIVAVEGSNAAEIFEEKIVFENAPAKDEKVTVKYLCRQEPGGAFNEEFNLISSCWKESFLCDTGTEREFTLSKTGLSEEKVKAWVLEEGIWQEKYEGTDFSVDREKGKIIFANPICKTPVAGEDNLIIEAAKYFEGYEAKINRSRRSVAFGKNGTSDRIFVCGNPEEPDSDRWCAAGDPTYWPDTYYSKLGNGENEILGYSVLGDMLATYLSEPKDGRSIVIRAFELDDDGNATFPVVKNLMGEGAIAPAGFVFMEKEQLFLTARGVYAITTEDVSGEKYTQNRSYFINKALCAEENLEKAFCTKWKQFYVIAINGKLYLLDSSRKSYERGEPLSASQYESYLWTGIDARVIWEEKGILFFGNEEGKVYRFTEDGYSDDGKSIEAYWSIPDFCGENFWKNKTVKIVAAQLAPFEQNKVRIEYKTDGFWKVLKEWTGKISYFGWKKFSWADFCWSGNKNPRTVLVKTKIKKFDKAGFRIVCDGFEKAFGLYGFSLEYTENGRYKK